MQTHAHIHAHTHKIIQIIVVCFVRACAHARPHTGHSWGQLLEDASEFLRRLRSQPEAAVPFNRDAEDMSGTGSDVLQRAMASLGPHGLRPLFNTDPWGPASACSGGEEWWPAQRSHRAAHWPMWTTMHAVNLQNVARTLLNSAIQAVGWGVGCFGEVFPIPLAGRYVKQGLSHFTKKCKWSFFDFIFGRRYI